MIRVLSMARNFGHPRAVNIQTWEHLKQRGCTKLQYMTLIMISQHTALPLMKSFRNVEMFYLILFFGAKLDSLIQYMTFGSSCVFAANSQQRIRIGKRYK